ncbi:MAG: phosphoglucosamine mutase [Bacilli bacterium]|nr:phosphoglucosamine mutase [Bacilli bacterium]
MGKLFGTDGIRGLVPDELDVSLSLKIGFATARVLKETCESPTLLVGTDTRQSKDMLKSALIDGVLSEGADIIDLGVIPTPAVSYLIKKYKADGGFVISASHNPSEYNGIKVFNSEGMKLDDEIESRIEKIILDENINHEKKSIFGIYRIEENAVDDYVEFLLSTLDEPLKNLKVAIDVANGAAFKTARRLFSKLGIEYSIINDKPDGLNINSNSGSTHIEGLQEFVKKGKFDCGIAFDGDADRCLFVDENGKLVDGDQIMAISSNYLKSQNMLNKNTLVGTVMSNLGLRKFCSGNDIQFVATKVGDRYVLENMLENDYVLGGEQSGHIIYKNYSNTGDGEITALQILNILSTTKKRLSELANIMPIYPQVQKSVAVSRDAKDSFNHNQVLQNKIKEIEGKLGDDGRVLVRASGTENLIRVMLEGKDIDLLNSFSEEIISIIKKAIA